MTWKNPDFITPVDIGIAYRKAKADLFYGNGRFRTFALCEYEENLSANLDRLYEELLRRSLRWMTSPEFVGEWAVIPKQIPPEKLHKGHTAWRPSNPDRAWEARLKNDEKPTAEFRLVGIHSIDFHVVSSLWMHKVGHLYDSALGPEAYGSRLRRFYGSWYEGEPPQPNPWSTGSFKHYLRPYRQWRDRGLTAIRTALAAGKRVVAITVDVREFYHRTSPDFLLKPAYLRLVNLEGKMDSDRRRFTQALIGAIRAWAARTPVHRDDPTVGIPVGLGASQLIANVALLELDGLIKRELKPLYYGRYVDDILLVLEDTSAFSNSEEVWDFILSRIGQLERVRRRKEEEYRFHSSYLGNSRIAFAGKKTKVFLLEGSTGAALVETIERQIRARSSEWRALPDVPTREDALAADVIAALGDDGDEADNLRKADSLSIRRAAFAIRLRNMEAFEQELPSEAWAKQRAAFFRTVNDHLVALPKLFEFAPYLTRLFGLAIACRDYHHGTEFLERLITIVDRINAGCRIGLAGKTSLNRSDQREVVRQWSRTLAMGLSEALAGALAPRHLSDSAKLEDILGVLRRLASTPLVDGETALSYARRLFFRDLGRAPFRLRYFPFGAETLWSRDDGFEIPTESRRFRLLSSKIVGAVASFLDALPRGVENRRRLPQALLFPTRPFAISELYFLVPSLLTGPEKDRIRDWARAFGGILLSNSLPGTSQDDPAINIPWNHSAAKIRIALTSLRTENSSWVASVRQAPDPDTGRHDRITRLLNGVISSHKKPRYVILPELSVPSHWFLRFAKKLADQNISLIAGVEYVHHAKGIVANQVWASLVSDFPGSGFALSVTYRQDKHQAALHEEADLLKTANLTLRAIASPIPKPILSHGGFRFGILICNELTDLEYRRHVRGNVDAVFIPEWNKDAETFSALVESAALDVHAYIVQCNNLQYGDSRIRSPRRQSFERDVIRLKGGLEDYFVVGEIDVAGLRRFQSADRSNDPDAPFKPVPDGFVIDPRRKVIP